MEIKLNISDIDYKVLNTEMDVDTFFQDFIDERIRRKRDEIIPKVVMELINAKKKIPQSEDDIIALADLESAKDRKVRIEAEAEEKVRIEAEEKARIEGLPENTVLL